MNRPQVAYFLSGVLVYFPSGARKRIATRSIHPATNPHAMRASFMAIRVVFVASIPIRTA